MKMGVGSMVGDVGSAVIAAMAMDDVRRTAEAIPTEPRYRIRIAKPPV
jgi:hypothetical protein